MGLVAAVLLYLLDYKIIQSISHSVPTKSVAHSLSALTPILCLPHTVPLPSTPLVYEVLPRPFHHLLFGLFANLVRQAALPPTALVSLLRSLSEARYWDLRQGTSHVSKAIWRISPGADMLDYFDLALFPSQQWPLICVRFLVEYTSFAI